MDISVQEAFSAEIEVEDGLGLDVHDEAAIVRLAVPAGFDVGSVTEEAVVRAFKAGMIYQSQFSGDQIDVPMDKELLAEFLRFLAGGRE